MTTEEKLVVLQFDEMKMQEMHEFDVKHDRVIGPHSQMQVVNARGLFGKWKQPVYVGFDTKITPLILNGIINRLYGVGFKVIACVSDCGGGNIGLWKDLGITYENVSIIHQCAGTNIYFFADAPHLLKLIRNWLVDTGFKIDNKLITKKPLEELISSTNSEINSCFKLNSSHLKCEGFRRQNVSLAAELMSHTTASALNHYFSSQEAHDTSEFISMVNSWFDLMNSYVPNNLISAKAAYGMDLAKQNEILDLMYHTILNMRCVGKRVLQIFQKGILLSINSIKALYLDVHENYKMKYILTHRLNQDVLENIFSQLRTRGGLNDHPSPLNALQRLKMIILGKSSQLQLGTNTTDKSSDEFIIGKVLLQCDIKTIDDVSSLSSTSTDTLSQFNVDDNLTTYTENDGFEYLAGWMAKKLKNSHPELGDYTHKLNHEHDYVRPSWVRHLSFGGLVAPTTAFKSLILQLDKEFNKYMGDGLKNDKDITKKLLKKFQITFPSIDEDIIKLFIKHRIFIRINYLNTTYNEKKNDKTLKRRVLQIKQNHKLRKICN